MITCLLVTGSRALASNPAAKSKAIETIRLTANSLVNPVLVAGDTAGPDSWALEYFRSRQWPAYIFRLNGNLERLNTWGAVNTSRWAESLKLMVLSDKKLPLYRNEKMVEFAAEFPRVLVCALKASWSKTHVTDYTVRIARKHNLDIEQHAFELEVEK